MKLLRSACLCLILLSAVGAAVSAHTALADGSPSASSLSLDTAPVRDDKGKAIPGRLLIVATLVSADGEPLSEVDVSYFEEVEFMGQLRNADLGVARTDSTGVAAIAYQPSTIGPHTIRARFAGDVDHPATESPAFVLQVTQVKPVFESSSEPFATLRHWMPWGVGLIVLGTWIAVTGTFIRAARGIWTAGRTAAHER